MHELIQHRAYELGDDTMTRTERIAAYLASAAGPDGCGLFDMATEILAIADDRTLLNLQDVSSLLCRDKGTVRSWHLRGQYDFPAPAYVMPGGVKVWDAEVVSDWATERPGLVGKI